MSRSRSPVLAAVVGACSASCLPAGVLVAQTAPPVSRLTSGTARDTTPVRRGPAPTAGGLTGQIVDATTGEVLSGALVVLVLRPEGVLAPAGTSSFPALAREARTDALGRYRFGALAPGAYRLRASRLGYAAATAEVTVADAAPDVSLGLTVAPLALRPVEVRGTASGSQRLVAGAMTTGRGGDAAGRLRAVEDRQRVYLTPDAREITRTDVAEAVTLAESDLFRALQRLPGVSTRDEWAAELWTRGSRADMTRVRLDGLSLFGPVAAFGAFAAVNADAVGSATLLPGVRPADVGEGGAGVLDLRTRAGGRVGGRTTSGIGGVGEVGIASARVTLDGATSDGRLAGVISGRRSYLDGIAKLAGPPAREIPNFGDLTARGDLRLSATQTIAVSGLLQQTYGSENWKDPENRSATWGNRLLRVTHTAAVGGLSVRHTLGGSVFAVRPRGAVAAASADPYAPAGLPNDTTTSAPAVVRPSSLAADLRVSALVFRGEIAPAGRASAAGASESLAGTPPVAGAAEPTWSAGYEVSRQATRYSGPGLTYFAGSPIFTQPAGSPVAAFLGDSVAVAGRATIGAVWGTERWHPTSRLTLEPGLRLELAEGAGLPLALRPSPRLAARFALDADTRLSAAVGRSVQYTQAVPRIGLTDAARFSPAELWLTAGRAAPPLVTDLATLGVERWLGAGWLGGVNAYVRRTGGFVTNDPAPGLPSGRTLDVTGRESGHGVELSARRLVGRTTATLAYSWSASTVDAGGFRYASPQDRTHVFDATVSYRATARWRLGGAFSAATGTPYTRAVSRYFVPDTAAITDAQSSRSEYGGLVLGAPNAQRNPGFFGADLLAEWSRPVRSWHLAAYAQLHSPLADFTSDAYRGQEDCFARLGSAPTAVFAPGARCTVWGRTRHADTFPVIPTVGLRVGF